MRTLATLLTDYLMVQCEALREGEQRLRNGTPNVHATRVAVRRIRAAVTGYADLFDPDRAASVDQELRWYAQLLGTVRDAEVLRKHFSVVIRQLPPELVVGPVADRIETELDVEHEQGMAAIRAALDGPRYAALRTEVERWASQPPVTTAASRPARTARSYVTHARRRTRQRLRSAVRHGDDARLHAARKAAKRYRYTLDVGAPTFAKKDAKRRTRRVQRIQDSLGEFQDAVVAGQLMLKLHARAEAAGEDGFTYGVLYSAERHRAESARRQVRGRRL